MSSALGVSGRVESAAAMLVVPKRIPTLNTRTTLPHVVRRAKSTRASLQADLSRIRAVPTEAQVVAAAGGSAASGGAAGRGDASAVLMGLSQRALQAEERCILYRTSGWTVFEIDLDVGRRQRALRREQPLHSSVGAGNGTATPTKAALALGVRLDTFFRGRFCEPYYLVFAKSSQRLDNVPHVHGGVHAGDAEQGEAKGAPRAATSSLSDDSSATFTDEQVRLLRHTIPHFVPLQSLVQRFLGDGGLVRKHNQGGLELLGGLMDRQGLWTFLSHLHSYVQAFVARREQAMALCRMALPGYRRSKLAAHGNDAFTQIVIIWEMPTPDDADLDALARDDEVLRSKVNASDTRAKPPPPPPVPRVGDEHTSVRISLRFADFDAAHLGAELDTVEASSRDGSDRLGALRALASNAADLLASGLVCSHGTALVELIHCRVPPPRRGGDDATTVPKVGDNAEQTLATTVRRRDWEQAFSASAERDFDRATGDVIVAAWREVVQRHDEVSGQASSADALRETSSSSDNGSHSTGR